MAYGAGMFLIGLGGADSTWPSCCLYGMLEVAHGYFGLGVPG